MRGGGGAYYIAKASRFLQLGTLSPRGPTLKLHVMGWGGGGGNRLPV